MNVKKAEMWGFFITADLGADISNISGVKKRQRKREDEGRTRPGDTPSYTNHIDSVLLTHEILDLK